MTIVKQESDGIVFCNDDGHWFYDLHVNELHRQGMNWWIDHMSRKNWFTPDVRAQFVDYCRKHSVSSHGQN